MLYALFCTLSFVIQAFFERASRPKYIGEPGEGELVRSGDDLDAKGLTEWMWDVLYWTWGCTALASLVGDQAWWLMVRIGTGFVVKTPVDLTAS